MLPPALRMRASSPPIRKIDVSQFTILTDWENFSCQENFTDEMASIDELRNV